MPEPKFNAGDFIRRLETGEFEGGLCEELDKLTPYELEELALILTSHIRAKAAGVKLTEVLLTSTHLRAVRATFSRSARVLPQDRRDSKPVTQKVKGETLGFTNLRVGTFRRVRVDLEKVTYHTGRPKC